MKNLSAVLSDLKVAAFKYPELTVSLFENHLGRYLRHRLSYFFMRFGVKTAIHIAEFSLLYFIFRDALFVQAVVARTFLTLLSAYWWGSLEKLREDVRQFVCNSERDRVKKVLCSWHSLSCYLAVMYFCCSMLYFILNPGDTPRSTTLSLYMIGIHLRVAFQFVILSLHSGVYALRRIYRPMWSIFIVDLATFLFTLCFWPFIGALGLGISSILSAFMGAGIILHFLKKAYDQVPYLQYEFNFSPMFLWRTFCRHFGASLAPGIANMALQFDALVVIALALLYLRQGVVNDVVALCYLIAPFFSAAHTWARLFYFDFKKVEGGELRPYERSYKENVFRLAIINGVLFWGLFYGVIALSPFTLPAGILVALLPIFVLRSLLAYAQIRAFAERRYLVVIFSAAILFFMVCLTYITPVEPAMKMALLSGALFITLVLLRIFPESFRSPFVRTHSIACAHFLCSLKNMKDQVGFGILSLSSVDNGMACNELEKYLCRVIGVDGHVTAFEDNILLWYTRKPQNVLYEELIINGFGLIDMLHYVPELTAPELVREQILDVLPVGKIPNPVASPQNTKSDEALCQLFEKLFPEGKMFRAGQLPKDFTSEPYYRSIIRSAFRYLKNYLPCDAGNGHHVSAMLEGEQIGMVFAIPRSGVPRRRLKLWDRNLRFYNTFHALGK